MVLSARNITKRYGGITAVRNASLDVSASEIVSIIGPNGAGKSTLLKIICGLLPPDVGEVNFNKVRVSWRFPFRHYRSPNNLAAVLQRSRVVAGLTPTQNMEIGFNPGRGRSFFRSLMPSGYQLRLTKVEPLLREFLGDHHANDAAALSGGQKRILELLRLKISRPLMVVLDEPTAGLHRGSIDKLMEILRELTESGAGVLISEHNLDFVNAVSDRIVEMNRGDIVVESTREMPHEVPSMKLDLVVDSEPNTNVKRTTEDLVLRVRNLSAGYGSVPIFHSLSFDLHQSSCLSFVGANGSGKSTALKAIADLTPWRTGEVIWGNDVGQLCRSMLGHPKGIAFVLQSHRIFDQLTVNENLLVAADRLPTNRARVEAISKVRSQLPELSDSWLGKPGFQLSGGEQQLLAIAQGLICAPRLLVLDEPTAGLNRAAIKKLQVTLRRLREHGTAIIMAEHNMEFVRALSDQILMFDPGGVSFSRGSAIASDHEHNVLTEL